MGVKPGKKNSGICFCFPFSHPPYCHSRPSTLTLLSLCFRYEVATFFSRLDTEYRLIEDDAASLETPPPIVPRLFLEYASTRVRDRDAREKIPVEGRKIPSPMQISPREGTIRLSSII